MNFVKLPGALLWFFPNAAVGSILSPVMELQLIYVSQETIVIFFFFTVFYHFFLQFPSCSFTHLWWISCHHKVFSIVVCFALKIFGRNFYSSPCSHAHEHRRRQVSGGLNFSVCIGLTWQGFGRGVLGGRVVQGWLLWEENRKFPCIRVPIPASSRMDHSEAGCPLYLNLELLLGGNIGRFWHLIMACRMEWPSNCKCIQVLWAEQEECCPIFLIFL